MKKNNIQQYLNKENTCLAIPRKSSTCLLQENYLSEFDAEEEKEFAMENLLLLDEVPTKDSKRLVNSGSLADVLENLENGINSNIENLSTETEGINEDIGDIKNNINTIETNIGDINEDIGDIKDDINTIKTNNTSNIENLSTEIGNINENIEGINEEIEDINEDIESIRNNINTIETDNTSNIENLSTEIESINEGIRDINGDIEGINGSIGNINEEIGNINEDIEGVKSNINTIETNISSIETNINEDIGGINRDIEDINENIEGINEEIRGIKNNINTIGTNNTSNIENLSTEIGNINEDIEDINEDIGGINENIGNINEGIEGINEEIEGIKDNINTIETNINTIETNINTIETNINGDIESINGNIEGINEDIEGIETNISNIETNINGDIENINGEIGGIKSNINTIETNISGIETNISGIETNIDTIETNISGIETNIDDIETNIDTIETDINNIQNEVNNLNIEIFNKQYDSENFSGMGKIYLQKNIVNGNNLFVQNMLEDDEGNPLTNTIFVIQYDYYLNNKTIYIPSNCVLWFDGGSLSNGTLVGTNTQIIASNYSIFTGITIEGTWNVPYITSTWFSDATQNNKLKNVFALQNENILNRIIIEEGNYSISTVTNAKEEIILNLKSNLDLIINGTITLSPSNLTAYYILYAFDQNNICISGSGTIIGDKFTHTGTDEGQWGHGIYVAGKFITIKDIKVINCWGDCICIGKSNSQSVDIKNIIIDNCYLDNGRRQGISITHGDNIVIRNCYISNVNGHNPQAGIDIEPNSANYAQNIVIENCRVENCKCGIVIYGKKQYYKSCIYINNCYIQCERRALSVNGIDTSVSLKNCEIHTKLNSIYANTIDGSLDNLILFENNMIYQYPENGADLSAEVPCTIYAGKGNYKFNHNFIKSVLPVFCFAGGRKYVEDNEIISPYLFMYHDVDNVILKGNYIKGDILIPGNGTQISGNDIKGTIRSSDWDRFNLVSLSIPNKDVDPEGYYAYLTKYNPSEKNWYVMSENGLVKTNHTSIVDGTTYYKKGEGGTDKYSYITNNTILSSGYVLVNTSNYNNSTNPSNREWYEIYPGNRYVGMDWSSTTIAGEEYWQNVTEDVYVPTEDETIKSGKNYYALSSSNGSSEFSSQGTIYFDNNRIRNIKLDINGGSFTNNTISYNSYFNKTGMLINCGGGTVSGNTIKYEQTVENDTDIFNVYLIRANNITNNTISTNCKVKFIFYPGGDAYITGNILSIPNGYNKIVRTSDVNNFIQPVYRNTGTTQQRPIFAVDEYYYVGCKYFDTDLNRFITWNGSKWIDADGSTAGVLRKGNSANRPSSADIYSSFVYNDTTLDKPIFWDGVKWIESDGATAGVTRKGASANRPSANDIYINFIYFDTTLDKPIIWSGNQWVDAVGAAVTVRIQYFLTNISASNEEQPEVGTQFTTVLTADEGYSLPATIRIDMDSNTLTAGTDYTYNQSTGEVVVLGVGGIGGVTGRKLQIVATGVGQE